MSIAGPIFIDAAVLASDHLTGLGRYAARLALAVAKRGRPEFFDGDHRVVPPPGLDWSEDQDLARWARKLMRGRREPLAPGPSAVGIYPCLRTKTRRFATEVSILHDLTPSLLPETHTAQTVAEFRDYFAKGLTASDVVVADSHATRADAAWLCDVPESRMIVGPPGGSLCVGRHLDVRPVARRPEVGLVVATIEPRKNADFLLDWFLTTEAVPDGAELWWVGARGWKAAHLARGSTKGRNGRRIRWLGVVDDRTLCRLHRAAGWVVSPSFYEGFGFPVVDALRHGASALAAGNSSLREFAGPGVGLFDPIDGASLDRAFARLRGGDLGTAPIESVDARFSWDRLVDLLTRAVESRETERRVA